MNLEQATDKATGPARRAIDILFGANPAGTSLGVMTGVFFDGVFRVFSPLIEQYASIRSGAISLWHFVALGILIFNVPAYLRRHRIDPKIEDALAFIRRESERGELPKWQRRMMYENLYNKVLQSIVLDAAAQEGLQEIEDTLLK